MHINYHSVLGQTELLLQIFQWLDAPTLLKTRCVCHTWKRVYNRFEEFLWKGLCFTEFNFKEKLELKLSWKQFYQNQISFNNFSYRFVSGNDHFQYDDVKTEIENINAFKGNPIFTWPSEDEFFYKIALEGNKICWFDNRFATIFDINVGILDSITPDMNIKCVKKLMGHSYPIVLLLSNGKGSLLSFDNSSIVFVWDMNKFESTGSIKASKVLVEIISMNLQNNLLVCGGLNGKIAVWNIETFELIFVLDSLVDSLNAINVGVWNNLLVYGMKNGKFVAHDIVSNKIKHIFDTNLTLEEPIYPPVRQLIEDGSFLQDLSNQEPEPVHQPRNVETLAQFNQEDGFVHVNQVVQDQINDPQAEFLPRTLALNAHILITNSAQKSKILVWDLVKGELLGNLSEQLAGANRGLFIPDPQEVNLGELSRDGTLVYTTVEDDSMSRVLLWDFSAQNRRINCLKAYLDDPINNDGIEIWIGVEDDYNQA